MDSFEVPGLELYLRSFHCLRAALGFTSVPIISGICAMDASSAATKSNVPCRWPWSTGQWPPPNCSIPVIQSHTSNLYQHYRFRRMSLFLAMSAFMGRHLEQGIQTPKEGARRFDVDQSAVSPRFRGGGGGVAPYAEVAKAPPRSPHDSISLTSGYGRFPRRLSILVELSAFCATSASD